MRNGPDRLTLTADAAIPGLAGLQRRMLIAGGVGALVSLVGALIESRQFFQSYLMAYMLWLGVTLGCLALGMVHQLTGGAWGVLIRRPIGAATRVLPVMTALFVPVLLGMSSLYPWTDANLVAHDPVLQHERRHLHTPFFLVRAALYFLVWNALTYLLNAWSLEQDRNPDPQLARRMQKLSAVGLLAYGLTITFASFDWLMSLEPHWFSTIFGVLIIGGQGLSAMAAMIIVLAWLARRPPLAPARGRAALPRRPFQLTVDDAGAFVVLAFNKPRTLMALRLAADGTIGAPVAQAAAPDGGFFVHQVRVAPGGRTVLACAMGA